MILYKFASAQRALNILDSGSVRFSQLAALNDPFESFPQTEGFVTRGFVFKMFNIVLSHEDILNNLVEDTYQGMYNDLSTKKSTGYLMQLFCFKKIPRMIRLDFQSL